MRSSCRGRDLFRWASNDQGFHGTGSDQCKEPQQDGRAPEIAGRPSGCKLSGLNLNSVRRTSVDCFSLQCLTVVGAEGTDMMFLCIRFRLPSRKTCAHIHTCRQRGRLRHPTQLFFRGWAETCPRQWLVLASSLVF